LAHETPFGKAARVRILKQHLAVSEFSNPEDAWKFIYEELLWVDGSTGLAHLYESDKAQPGRPWHNRSVVFTDLLCSSFGGITRAQLRRRIDRLFRACLQELLSTRQSLSSLTVDVEQLAEALVVADILDDVSQEGVVDSIGEPEDSSYTPDYELVVEFAAILGQRLRMPRQHADSLAKDLVARARFYFTVERKRQNVLGEGFEDLLHLLMINIGRVSPDRVKVRQRANTLSGFQSTKTARERIEAPDIAIVGDQRTELIASVKWSLRHDRQKQLSDELDCYAELLSQADFPRYVLITNEYDPGRLVNADVLIRREQKVDCIYHLNLEILLACLHDHERIHDLMPMIEAGRLRSVSDFLSQITQQFGEDANS
jgi:hypothetical protein